MSGNRVCVNRLSAAYLLRWTVRLVMRLDWLQMLCTIVYGDPVIRNVKNTEARSERCYFAHLFQICNFEQSWHSRPHQLNQRCKQRHIVVVAWMTWNPTQTIHDIPWLAATGYNILLGDDNPYLGSLHVLLWFLPTMKLDYWVSHTKQLILINYTVP